MVAMRKLLKLVGHVEKHNRTQFPTKYSLWTKYKTLNWGMEVASGPHNYWFTNLNRPRFSDVKLGIKIFTPSSSFPNSSTMAKRHRIEVCL